MKRLGTFALIFALIFLLCACGRKEQPEPTQTRPAATDPAPSILPEMDPTLDTNIPDPTVDSNSTGQDGNMGESENDMGGMPQDDGSNGNSTSGNGQNGNNSSGNTNENHQNGATGSSTQNGSTGGK